MALPLRTRAIPQCTACLRSHAFTDTLTTSSPAWRQQVRGRKSSAKAVGTMPARLLKDYPGFGRKGSIVPLTKGEMRNKFFPRRIAEYVTVPELKVLRADNIPIQRDYNFGLAQSETISGLANSQSLMSEYSNDDEVAIAMPKHVEPERLLPERSVQLLEIFVNPILEFYRQPIMVEKDAEEAKPEPKKERQRTASSAAADLLAARTQAPLERAPPTGPQAIYGSVSTHDVLVHVRAAINVHDEAARVILNESDIEFFDKEIQEEGKVKHVGDFTISISVKGAPTKVKRTVRVIPQEA